MGGDGVMGFVKGRRETNTASHSLLHLYWPALRDVEKPALLQCSNAHVLHVPNSMRADDYCREVESGIMQLNTRRLNGRVNPLIHLSALFKGHPSPRPLSQPELLHLQCACGLVMVLIICCPMLQFLIYAIKCNL